MGCEKTQEKFVDFLTGELKSGEMKMVRDHIRTCGDCRDELASLNEIWTRLGVLPEEIPSENMRKRFYNMLESRKPAPPQQERQGFLSGLGKRVFWPQPAAQAVLLAAVLILGFSLGTILPSFFRNRSEVRQLRTDVQDMRQLVVLSLLERTSASKRLEGVAWSNAMTNLDPRTFDSLLQTMNNDSNVNVRLSSLDSLIRFKRDPRVRQALIQSLPHQSSPMVQVSLIDQIGPWSGVHDTSALRKLLENPGLHPAVRRTVIQSLEPPI